MNLREHRGGQSVQPPGARARGAQNEDGVKDRSKGVKERESRKGQRLKERCSKSEKAS